MNQESTKIEPHKVTKPIQLLAAWLVGLIAVNTGFLFAAVKLGSAHWASSALVIAAIINVPLFLAAIFLLQTKFRPELQEDSYYSKYLDKKSNKFFTTKVDADKDTELVKRVDQIQNSISSILDNQIAQGVTPVNKWRGWQVSLNDLHGNIDTIRRALSDAGIPIQDYFGSSSIEPKPPEQFTIAFRENMDAPSCMHLLRQVAELGFSGYYYFNEPREIDPEDVYLGAYGQPSKIIPINDELLEMLKNETLSSSTLRNFEAKHA